MPDPFGRPLGPSVKCPECGYFHPIDKDGCPIARAEAEYTKSGVAKKDIETFLSQAKNIIMSKGSKISKNQEKFFTILTKTFYELVEQVIKTL